MKTSTHNICCFNIFSGIQVRLSLKEKFVLASPPFRYFRKRNRLLRDKIMNEHFGRQICATVDDQERS